MGENFANDLVLVNEKVEKIAPNYELSKALIEPAERIASDISEVFDRLGTNQNTSFPMEKTEGFTPEPISMFVVRQVDMNSNPVETLQVIMKDRSTVELVQNGQLVASYNRDKSAPDQAKWIRIRDDSGTLKDDLSFEDLIHSRLTNLADRSVYRDDPANCASIIDDYLNVNPIEEIFEKNHNKSSNFSSASQTN